RTRDGARSRASGVSMVKTMIRPSVAMHLIPAHQGRPSDDPIFSLHREATQRSARGGAIVNATVGAPLDDAGKLAIVPSTARAVHEVPAVDWASYAPIAGTPEF